MLIEEALNSYLLAQPEVVQLLGARIYPLTIPQESALPAMAFQRISGPQDVDHQGEGAGAVGRFQLTVNAEDALTENKTAYIKAKEAARALRRCLRGYKGLMGSPGIQVWKAGIENEVDSYNPVSRRMTVRLDVVLYYEESE